MDENLNNVPESSDPSVGQELANVGQKTINAGVQAKNLALGMKGGIKEGLGKKKDGEDKKDDKKDDSGNKESSLDKPTSSIEDGAEKLGKKAVKQGGEIAKKGAKAAESGLKKLWHLIPTPYNFLILGGLALFLVVFIIIFMVVGSESECDTTESTPYLYSCTKITVGSTVLDLEDYVAGVVSAESYSGQSIEAIKAQAVAARTYALYYTNDCTTSIPSSSAAQNYTSNYRDDAIEAVEATAGEVLIYDGSIFKSEYDSFNGSCCSAKYKLLPTNETHVVKISSAYSKMIAGGHGRGMSQVASYYLANDEGYTYDEILKYFYSEGVEIANHSETDQECATGLDYDTGFRPRTSETGSIYSDSDALSEIASAAPNVYNLLSISSLKYQCVTYARLRAVEILLTADVYDDNESARSAAISIINNNSNNGWGWYPGGIPALSAFNWDSTCSEFKPGSLISFIGNNAKCGLTSYNGSGYCGHVAIVEDVDYENETVRLTDGYSSLYGAYHEVNASFSEVKNLYGGCIATTYLLEYNG